MQEQQYIHVSENGNKYYYKDKAMTICHRSDGPAIEHHHGFKSWFINGKLLSKTEFDDYTAPTLELTLEDIAAKYGVDVSKIKIVK